jgi:hypothetical protein
MRTVQPTPEYVLPPSKQFTDFEFIDLPDAGLCAPCATPYAGKGELEFSNSSGEL